ncbi:hypothetical protein PG994_008210 [Apiospora phragmitis]|uniref:Ketoreductase domain-containing protein n=1 Tax=Apiospora phragmitis TaxID=2905665 RepID=A0ABR1USE0_9PEZI
MASPTPSYTKLTYSATYPAIDPTLPALSTSGKVILVTGASGGIGRAASLSFAASGPKSLVLLGRKPDALAETANLVRSRHGDLAVETHQVDLCDAPGLRAVFDSVASKLGTIDVLVHCAGVLAPVVPLMEADPATFMDSYKTTVVGTLALAQAFVGANNQSAAGAAGHHLPKPDHGRHPVPALPRSSRRRTPTCACTTFTPADFLVWIASPEAKFLHNKIVFASWDVEELKSRETAIVGGPPGTGELWLGYQGFPRYISGQSLGRP